MENLTSNNFNELRNKKLVFVDFWAGWCGPCMALAPLYENVSKKYQERAEFMKCNVDEEQELAVHYGIMSIPCILVFVNGEVKDKLVGLTNENLLTNFIEKQLN